ncbi:hypothetical protein [Aestuariivirga sp.]|uniref:hypothetical protein n=1 Tax=Aestuariivirga sp. TaxID=2650926 RepID=UPI00359320CF
MMALSSKRPSQRDEIKARLLNDVAETNEKKRRLNTEIEDSLYRRIKGRAAEEGRTISSITRDLWIEFLSK